jgi:cell division protein FtsI/penicillin-binding protein 2
VKAGELVRVRVAFGALGFVPVLLVGWLFWVQVAQAGELPRRDPELAPLRLTPATADRQGLRAERVPAPRGSIVDRNGQVLATDCESYEVRARIGVPSEARGDVSLVRAWVQALADDLALLLVSDPEQPDRSETRDRHAKRLRSVIARTFAVDQLPSHGQPPAGHPMSGEVLVAGDVDRLAVVEALRRFDADQRTITLDFLRSYDRVYPDRAITYGIVGHCGSRFVPAADGRPAHYETLGVCGLETFQVLAPQEDARRRFLKDGRGRSYFMAPVEDAPAAPTLHTTIDLDLQRHAMQELALHVHASPTGVEKGPAKWGAIVLVEIATGDVLVAASWHRGMESAKGALFTPYQSLFEPGSIVKPLVFAYALEAGALDWETQFDCAPGSAMYHERIAGLGRRRPVRDDHDCSVLSPHGVIVNSSNIGAVYVGLGLDRDQWRGYMKSYGFGASLGLNLPYEQVGGPNRLSFREQTPMRSFRANSAISFSMGYEMQATAMQVARAYLRLFRGAGSELRLCRGVEVDGQWQAVPVSPTGPQFRPDVVERVRAAMADVVSKTPGSTGNTVHSTILKELGIDLHGVIGGKTGTAVSHVGVPGKGTVEVRNASFVGFMPAEQPRWLAVCVLQKDDRAKFYGGRYAAPMAARLLLQCHTLDQRRNLRQESQRDSGGQTRVGFETPGSSGRGK